MEKNITLNVVGMTCGHCKAAVTGALKELPGVDEVNVDLETGKVDVSFDSDKVNIDEMKEAIEDQGYDIA